MIVSRWDGRALLHAVAAGTSRLEREAAEVDALNVYPLPDGDTGRNMLQTMRSALARAEGGGMTVREVSAALAKGGLMGARGNSGVILSQILRGMSEAFAGADEAGPAELRDAFVRARNSAFAAVDHPADGTMLSICAMVEERVPTEGDIGDVLQRAVDVGAESLERTMEDNPLNRAAGVVDAGAYGIWLLLAGALTWARGDSARVPEPRLRRPGVAAVAAVADDEVASWTGGHCVQYLVVSPRRAAEDLRREIVEAGADSVLVVGDASLIKVHAHAARPETITAIGETAGELQDVIVEDFDEMVAEHERATGIVLRSPQRPLAAVAVVSGEGLAQIVRSAYARPLAGGATMNPSVGELAAAIRAANAKHVVVLPNDRNVLLAAKEAAKLVEESDVEVLPAISVAQGMAALARFDPMSPAAAVLDAMRDSIAEVRTVEVTRATRDTELGSAQVREGEAIALVDGELRHHGDDPIAILVEAVSGLEGIGIVTLYSGKDVSEADAERAASELRAALGPRVEKVELHRGGQPHYPFIVEAE